MIQIPKNRITKYPETEKPDYSPIAVKSNGLQQSINTRNRSGVERLVFQNYFANWLINYKSTLVQTATIQRNYDDYRKYISGNKIDTMQMTAIKRADLKEFFNQTINKHHLTRKSLNNLKSLFNGMFAYALDAKDVTINPMLNLILHNTNIRPESLKEVETEIFNEKELDTLIKYLYEHYMEHRPVVTLALLLNFQLGLRVWELFAIKKQISIFNAVQSA